MRIGSATFAGLKGFSSDSPRSSAERRHHKRGAPAFDSRVLDALEFKAAGLRDPDGGRSPAVPARADQEEQRREPGSVTQSRDRRHSPSWNGPKKAGRSPRGPF